MIDGTVTHAVMDRAKQRCFICDALPSELNKLGSLSVAAKPEPENALGFGLSPLHARLGSMERLLNIVYRSPWGKRLTQEQKKLRDERTQVINDALRQRLDSQVNEVRVGGDASNTGNTSQEWSVL